MNERLSVSVEHVLEKVSQPDLDAMLQESLVAREHLLHADAEGCEYLGWVDLPAIINAESLQHIRLEVARLAKLGSVMVVVGIGGSYLGARMVIEALQDEFAAVDAVRGVRPYIVYAGHTLAEDYYHQLLNFLEQVDYTVCVISKSGTTTEPAVAFRLLKENLVKRYGANCAAERIVAITDGRRGALHDMANNSGYHSFVIPDNVGGRFSVLTPVGLLPIAMAGFDIDRLLDGARDMRRICLECNTLQDNPALLYAVVRNALYRRGIKVEMLVGCQPNLRYLAEWWKQLYGESEGKLHRGLLPHSISITTDLHSMGQYIQEGERLMMETMLRVERSSHCVSVPIDKSDMDGLNYLACRRLSEINKCAADGTVKAHVDGGVPVVEITVDKIDEYTLGQLIFFFEFACGVSGYMLGVNPFNQPGVEAYKNNMFRLLGKPGF